jgi:hypothetical protein
MREKCPRNSKKEAEIRADFKYCKARKSGILGFQKSPVFIFGTFARIICVMYAFVYCLPQCRLIRIETNLWSRLRERVALLARIYGCD